MITKDNAYAVLKLCQDDPHYNHDSLDTDICGHIAQHAGMARKDENGNFNWNYFVNHIGFAEKEWELWQLLNMDLPKDAVMRRFARMIVEIHGPAEEGIPSVLRLL